MKKSASATVALVAVGLGSPVLAADMSVKAPPPVVVQSWTGCYLGADAGINLGHNAGFSTTQASTQGTGGGPVPGGFVGNVTDGIQLTGGIAGAFGGCNYQVTRWVLGIEGDWSFARKQGEAFANAASVAAGFNPQRIWQTDERTVETARLRLGYAVTDQWLWYVTGGGAWAKIHSSQAALNNFAVFNAAESSVRGGWTAGLGTEYMFARGWSMRGEFLYVQIPSYAAFATTPPSSAMLTNMTTGKIEDYIVRAGVAYTFGWRP